MMDPRWLSLRDLAAYSGLSRSTLYRLLNDPLNPLPSIYVGRARRVDRLAFDAYMAQKARARTTWDAVLAEEAARCRR